MSTVLRYAAFDVDGEGGNPAGVVLDAAFGAYLRSLKLVTPPVRVTIHQGQDMGRPSRLLVDVPPGDGSGITVSGTATPLSS